MSGPPDLFDRHAGALRRERARRIGDPFLLQRAFDDVVERLATIQRPIERLLLVGTLDPAWPGRLRKPDRHVVVLDDAAGRWTVPAEPFDAIVAVGTLDTVNDLPGALTSFRQALAPDRPFLGALFGGDSLPTLRQALIAVDQSFGGVAPRAHPRIDGPTLAALLQHAGLVMPVVELDRVNLSYADYRQLIADLRAAAATNILSARLRQGFGKARAGRLAELFERQKVDGRFAERVELLQFLAWSPQEK